MKALDRLLSAFVILISLALPGTGSAATLYASGNGLGALVSIDTTTHTGNIIGAFAPAGPAYPLASTPDGRFWTIDFTTNTLQQVDPATGATTAVGFGTGIASTPLTMAADASGTMYATNDLCDFYTINLTTGAATLIGAATGACVYDMDFDGAGQLFGYAADLTMNYIVTIDPGSGFLTAMTPVTALPDIIYGGFAIDRATGTGYITSNANSLGPTNGEYYTVNLQTGWASYAGLPGVGLMWGATFAPPPPPTGISLSLNLPEMIYRAGDTLTLTATTTAGSPSGNADVWIRLALPGGTYRYLTATGTLSNTPAPILSNWPVASMSKVVFSHAFTGSEPLGSFTWQAALTQPGTQTYIGQPSLAPFSHQAPLAGKLVINEVDYDNVATDNNEFVEILNTGAAPVDLYGINLSLVNGATSTEYLVIDLTSAGILNPGEYLVVASATVLVDPLAKALLFPVASNNIQNGAPDGLALVDTINGVLLDALSYEGSITAATVTGMPGPVNLVEGGATTAFDDPTIDGSMIRFPNGSDINDAVVDWSFTTLPTPGVANVLQ